MKVVKKLQITIEDREVGMLYQMAGIAEKYIAQSGQPTPEGVTLKEFDHLDEREIGAIKRLIQQIQTAVRD